MAQFTWEGTSTAGQLVRGNMEAANEAAVIANLRRQQIRPVKVSVAKAGLSFKISIPGLAPSVKSKDVVVFTRQLATMVEAGLPLVQCLDILGQQQPSKVFAGV